MSFQSINLSLINLILGTLQPTLKGPILVRAPGVWGPLRQRFKVFKTIVFTKMFFFLFVCFALTGGPDQVGSYFTETEAGNHE